MKKAKYEDLLKIKNPILILREDPECSDHRNDRLRILYPNGRCEYVCCLYSSYESLENISNSFFRISCFSSYNLTETVKEIEEYDKKFYYKPNIYIQEIK